MNFSPCQLCWQDLGEGAFDTLLFLDEESGSAIVRDRDGRVRRVAVASLAPHPNAAALKGVTAEHGLLWRNGRDIDAPEADALARKVGIMYAEQLVVLLGGSYRRVQS